MPKSKTKPKSIVSRADFALVRLCLFVALGISLYLGWNSLQGGAIPGCGPASDCDKVLTSRWAHVFGIPVSFLAAPLYAALLGLTWQRELKWRPIILISAVIIGAAAWFVGVQFFALRAFCKFCMAAHAAGAIAGITLLRRNPIATQPSFGWAGAGVAAVAMLITAQSLQQTAGPAVTTYAAGQAPAAQPAASQPPSASRTEAENSAPVQAPAPTFTLLGGEFILNLNEVPIHGRLDAPAKVVKLFDYTCRYCRLMHHHFTPVFNQYSNQFSVISLAVPLAAECNHLIRQTSPTHRDACEYARLGLAVTYANPGKSHAFDEWVFAPASPPPISQARAYAENLVGRENLAKALIDPRIEARIQENIRIYMTNSRAGRSGKMPQLLFERGTSIGATTSPDDLKRILIQSMGLDTNQPAKPLG